MPSTAQNPSDEIQELIEILAKLSANEISLDVAARMLEIDHDGLVELIENSPHLVEQADALAHKRNNDPKKVIEKSHQGLSAAVHVLADRIQKEGPDMATQELVAATKTLENLIGFAKAQERAVRGDNTKDEQKYPLLIQDRRRGQFRIFMITPDSPQWVNTALPEFQTPNFDWLETFAPLSPSGDVLNIKELIAGHTRIMDDQGRVYGGA